MPVRTPLTDPSVARVCRCCQSTVRPAAASSSSSSGSGVSGGGTPPQHQQQSCFSPGSDPGPPRSPEFPHQHQSPDNSCSQSSTEHHSAVQSITKQYSTEQQNSACLVITGMIRNTDVLGTHVEPVTLHTMLERTARSQSPSPLTPPTVLACSAAVELYSYSCLSAATHFACGLPHFCSGLASTACWIPQPGMLSSTTPPVCPVKHACSHRQLPPPLKNTPYKDIPCSKALTLLVRCPTSAVGLRPLPADSTPAARCRSQGGTGRA